MRRKIIEAIKNFESDALEVLLDANKSYMDVSKALFINALKASFDGPKEEGCNGFDDVFFGICENCNKGCEGMTFLSDEGFYLDIFMDSKDGSQVDDIYICNKLTNLTGIEKIYDLSFDFQETKKIFLNPLKNICGSKNNINS